MQSDSLPYMFYTLVKNGLRFRYLRFVGQAGKPLAVSLEITHNCIAKCMMCNIWKIPQETPNLSMSKWIGVLSSELCSDLVELDITGGEPFLRADLSDLFDAVCDLRQNHLKALKTVAVTSNAFLTRRILDNLELALPKLKENGIDLIMVCAMDAIGELHVCNYLKLLQKISHP